MEFFVVCYKLIACIVWEPMKAVPIDWGLSNEKNDIALSVISIILANHQCSQYNEWISWARARELYWWLTKIRVIKATKIEIMADGVLINIFFFVIIFCFLTVGIWKFVSICVWIVNLKDLHIFKYSCQWFGRTLKRYQDARRQFDGKFWYYLQRYLWTFVIEIPRGTAKGEWSKSSWLQVFSLHDRERTPDAD